MPKKKTYPNATKALAHYEAALAILQETLSKVSKAELDAIEDTYIAGPTIHIPGASIFQIDIHNAGDAFRAAKKVLDPDRMLPSTRPKLEESA